LLAKSNWNLGNTKVSVVPFFGEVIGVVDEALSAPNWDDLAALEISGCVVVNITHVHAWAVSKDWGLGKLLSSQKH